MFFGGGRTKRRSRHHPRHRRKTHGRRKIRVGRKHSPSRTHRGRQNFVTGKRFHEYDRGHHFIVGKPFAHYRRHKTVGKKKRGRKTRGRR